MPINRSIKSIIDTHLHIWDVQRLHYPWLSEVPAINRTFTTADYGAATEGIPISQMVFVQCECEPNQYRDEINFVTQAAQTDLRIAGMVVWFPLEQPKEVLDWQSLVANPLIRGVRRLEEAPVSLYRQPQFIENLQRLPRYNLSFDICLKAHQLPAAVEMVTQSPGVSFMLDHLGKPDIAGNERAQWTKHIQALASHPKVWCKLSGMVTEADWQRWKPEQLRTYFDAVVDAFGHDRLVFGGDWPVVTLASSYQRWYNTLLGFCANWSEAQRTKLFETNARQFYRL